MLKYDKNLILEKCGFISDVQIRESVDSTNSVAKKLVAEGAPEGTLIISHNQTFGRGSNGRSWHTGEGQLAMSVILRPRLRKDSLPLITLISGLAVNEALEKITGTETRIKYPNDILLDDRKLCGILAESVMEVEPFVILGMGINIENEKLPVEISDIATSLSLQGIKNVPVNELIADIFCAFEKYYRKLI